MTYGITKDDEKVFDCDNCGERFRVTVGIEILDPDMSMEDRTVSLDDVNVKFDISVEMQQEKKMTELKK